MKSKALLFLLAGTIAGAAVYLDSGVVAEPSLASKPPEAMAPLRSREIASAAGPGRSSERIATSQNSVSSKRRKFADAPAVPRPSQVVPFPTRGTSDTPASASNEPPSAVNDGPDARSEMDGTPVRPSRRANMSPPNAAGFLAVNAASTEKPLPLAFQELDPVASGLNHDQATALEALREGFLNDQGNADAPAEESSNPAAPGKQLPPNYDRKLRALFGDAFAEKTALLAAQAEYAAKHPSLAGE